MSRLSIKELLEASLHAWIDAHGAEDAQHRRIRPGSTSGGLAPSHMIKLGKRATVRPACGCNGGVLGGRSLGWSLHLASNA
jgi:hypothetical protein